MLGIIDHLSSNTESYINSNHITRVVPPDGTGRLMGDFLIVRSWNIKTKQFLAELRLLHPGVHIY